MKEARCPNKRTCFEYGACEDCDTRVIIEEYEKRIARMEKQIEVLKNRVNANKAGKAEIHACEKCGKEDAHTRQGFTLCRSCAIKHAEITLAYYYRNREKVRKQQNEYRAKKREEAGSDKR